MIQKHRRKYSLYEGYTSDIVKNIDKNNQTSSNITDIREKMYDIPLNQVCIKASYNSAYDGKDINIEMLEYVINRGCRFLDFELYYNENDSNVYVNYSTDPTFTTFENVNVNKNTFFSMIEHINSSSINDPIFIHLRIKSEKPIIYNKIAEILKENNNKFYMNNDKAIPVNGNTKLTDIKSKIIIAMDKSINPYVDIGDLANYVNILTGGTTWSSQTYSQMKNQITKPPKPNDDFKTTNVTELKLVLPDIEVYSENPENPYDFIENYGVQTIAYRFYINDITRDIYEEIFGQFQSAFVPLGYVLSFIKSQRQENQNRNIHYGARIIQG